MVGASKGGGGELPRRRFRVIDYQERPGGPIRRWSAASRTRRCSRCQNYSYIDGVVVVVLDEQRRLRRATARDQVEMARLRGVMRMQMNRIREIQGDITMEQERTDALRE